MIAYSFSSKAKLSAIAFLFCLALLSCGQQNKKPIDFMSLPENRDAKVKLQGIWLDAVTDEVMLKAEGDTIYFADATSQPAYFRVAGDSIKLGPDIYHITKLAERNFWFKNHAGDEVRLVKHDKEAEEEPTTFVQEKPQVIATSEVINLDSVVMYNGQRYHWYITVNPTRYRVTRTAYTADGVAVENVYYDNIIHVSVFKGKECLYGRDFKKQVYENDVPADFLAQSILGNISFSHVDAQGFHFLSTVCIPEVEQCYRVENLIGFDGQLTMKLME